MKFFAKILILVGATFMTFNFFSQMPTEKSFIGKTPTIKLQEFFNGDMKAWGFLQNHSGEITRRFTVDMKGSWKNNQGILEETFIFDDGEKQNRTWTFDIADNGDFTGKAHDVVGVAKGKQIGNAINMKYVLRIPVGGKTYDISINDWLIQLDDKRLMNISQLNKFGFKVGSLTIFFEKK